VYNKDGDKMNDNQKRNVVVTTFLVICIFLILYFNMTIFISGPYLKDNKVEDIKFAIGEKLDASSIKFINKYALDEDIYVFEVVNDIGVNIVFYGNNKIYEQLNNDTYDEEKINVYVNNKYSLDFKINLGYYDNKPIIALVNDKQEIILDYYNYQELFIWNKGD
jgi:hypothetical protein